MDDQTKLTLAAALLGGYVLGRTKKGKLALSVGTYLAGKRLGLEPRQLATEGMRMLGEIPQVAEVQDQLKGEFIEAGRKAVTAAATRGMEALADTLRDRTANLGEKDEAEPEEEYEEEEPEEEEEAAPEEEEKEPERERPQRRRSSRKPARPGRGTAARRERAPSARSSSGAAAKEPSRKKSSATKPAAKKSAPAKKSAATKRAPAKRAASSGQAAKRTSKHADRRR
ncbi:histone protein [Streptomyces sp900116325]|uniref:histone protein n=1 Tax=Streptomyces sp. 900116325 TaxID=3154295 RepID=UPI0034040684